MPRAINATSYQKITASRENRYQKKQDKEYIELQSLLKDVSTHPEVLPSVVPRKALQPWQAVLIGGTLLSGTLLSIPLAYSQLGSGRTSTGVDDNDQHFPENNMSTNNPSSPTTTSSQNTNIDITTRFKINLRDESLIPLSALGTGTARAPIAHPNCQKYYAVAKQAPASATSLNHQTYSEKQTLVDKMVASLTPFSGDNRVDALLLPKIHWPKSRDLKYHIYTGTNDEVTQTARNTIQKNYPQLAPGQSAPNITHTNFETPNPQVRQAITYVTSAINQNTPFNLNQAANESEADIIFISSNLVLPNLSGFTHGPADTFLSDLRNYVHFDSNLALENQIKNFNPHGKKIVILFDHSILNSAQQADRSLLQPGDLYHQVVFHETLHALGLRDPLTPCYQLNHGSLPPGQTAELSCYKPNHYAVENTLMVHNTYPLPASSIQTNEPLPLETKQFPQSLQPFDYAALNYIAEHIACEQSGYAQGLTTAMMKKNPTIGDTTYLFTSDHWLAILERRCQDITPPNLSILIGETNGSGDEESGSGEVLSTPKCATYLQTPSLGKEYIQYTVIDPSGTDTYDFSTLAHDIKADLRAGRATTFDHSALAEAKDLASKSTVQAKGNLYQPVMLTHEQDYLIENIKTGSGNDTVIGNEADNYFDLGGSNNGIDIVSGEGGRDTFHISEEPGILYITDFQAGAGGDRLSLDPSFNIQTVEQLRHIAEPINSDGLSALAIHLSDNRLVVLNEVNSSNALHQDNL